MNRLFVTICCYIVRIILSLRYKVNIKGKELLNKKSLSKGGGILFLPNHPAHIDPVLITTQLWPKYQLKPVVIEYIYRQRWVNFLMKRIGAISIPNLDTSLNEIKLAKAKSTVQEIIKGLHKKQNYLLYPSGRLKQTGKEILGGASAVQTILQESSAVNVVLIRTTGLWGSSFSRAYTGKTPDLKATIAMNLKYLFKSFIFFMPKRKVLIEIEPAPLDFPFKGSRVEINQYLESWYNKYPTKEGVKEEEPINTVSYSPFQERLLKVQKKEIKKVREAPEIFSSKIEKEIVQEIAKISNRNENSIKLNMELAHDLGMDSLDAAELITFLGVKYEVGSIHPEDMATVQDVIEIAEGKKKPSSKLPQEQVLYKWPEEKGRPDPFLPMGKTIQEAFLAAADKMKNSLAVADDMLGPMTYKELKLSTLALSQEIKNYPGKYIGVLLPASVAAYMVILATLLANKIPVMLNWTLGPRYLNSMLQVTHTECVISSWKFLERLSNVEFGRVIKKLHLLEDIKKDVSTKKKMSALLKSYRSSKHLLKALKLDRVNEDDIAVVLFTSGTESLPKGVPLSHKNILSNIRGALECVDLKKDDIIYGILPPFHSFGFSIVGILPLASGIKVAYFPDPTDSHAMAEGISRWKTTMVCAAPSFLKGLLSVATNEQLKSIRLFVTAAEKTPKDLFDKVAKLGENKKLLEGYGITECSPGLTVNRPHLLTKGVGQPIPGVELCIIDPETHVVLGKNKEGEICARGDNVFKGYLTEQKSPFIEINGQKWYRTGDLGRLDDENFLTLSGRIKRFTKMGAEIVSLAAIEEVLLDELIRRAKQETSGPLLAVIAKEKEGDRPFLIVFTTVSLDVKEANMILKEAGFSRLVKITEIRKIEEIPLMGTGKIDYRYLQSMIG
ncbi:MAG: AMP-binding protein [Chlamydiae bacterium]|nr:AMP-binding protein [Chlamydiota bacterium]